MAKTKGGLTKWFKEDWVDIKTGKSAVAKKPKDLNVLTQLVGQKL